MSNDQEILIKENIYDKHGRIYIAKGTCIILDSARRELFKRIGIWEQIKVNKEANDIQKNHEEFKNEIMKMKQSYKGVDQVAFNYAVNKVHKIIFEEKIFNKYPYLAALTEHAQWYYTHSINVAILSILLAKKLGFDEIIVREIAIGALLHDIGLIFIDKEILARVDSELDEEEMSLKEKHCSLGVMTVKSAKVPYKSQKIIEQHHERLDGTGYPNGLREEEILKEAHIVAIADALDTETTYKVKEKAKSINEMLKEMHSLPERYNRKYIEALEDIFREK